MPLSWNEIKTLAQTFAKEWETESSEHAEAKTFWDQFFQVFGVSRRRVAYFESSVKKAGSKQGFIDLFWPGTLIVEHKSKGKDLDKAFQQAIDYFPGIKEEELPKYILISDFQRFRLYDLDENTQHEFDLRDLPNQVHLFGFIAGYEKRSYKEEDPVNIKAAELMGKLHDSLEEVGYTGHALELYLVRLLFCLFADDTNIFNRGIFWEYLDLHTKPDGSDLAMHLGSIFHTLNTPKENRLKNIDESLDAFPYVNGKLFEEALPPASFDSGMREMLIEACGLDWGSISPAIFGSMFQAVMNPQERRSLGTHYTSEKNIQKVIKPLFLDDLYTEFEKAKGNKNRLNELHKKIASLHFLDPACGCGNFLIISYRELRELEIQILRELNKTGQGFLDVREIIQVDVDQFAGIEIDEFAVRISEVAMWLIDHQMNMKVSEEFGQYFVRLPLTKAAKIVHGNALRLDWGEVVSYERLDFILGNPPFIGKQIQTNLQKSDMKYVLGNVKNWGTLDYVSAWYIKAAKYINGIADVDTLRKYAENNNLNINDGTLEKLIKDRRKIQHKEIKCAFVSTNSIAQGEQVGVLWNEMINYYHTTIHFAHRTFKWSNEARGNAAVHVVIIGFGLRHSKNKRIFDYTDLNGEPQEISAKNINPYLVDALDISIRSRSKPLCEVPEMIKGSQPTDGGNLLFDDLEKEKFVKDEPLAEKWIKPFVSAYEYLNGQKRWCLWLVGIGPDELKKMPLVLSRVNAVKQMRLSSTKASTVKWSQFPTLFTENRQPQHTYILVPSHSSETRKYIPFDFLDKNSILNNSCFSIPAASSFHFGVISSIMHMTWVKYTCGRIKSDYRYSNTLVYNNYPFPLSPTEAQKQKVETAAQNVLDTRAKYPDSSLADLYDPLTMPPDLVKAHQALDKAVDLCYRPQPFPNELSRIEYLFGLYEEYTAGLFAEEGKKKGKK